LTTVHSKRLVVKQYDLKSQRFFKKLGLFSYELVNL
jgi:hypothetical protein